MRNSIYYALLLSSSVYIFCEVANGIFDVFTEAGNGKKGQDGGNGVKGRDSDTTVIRSIFVVFVFHF